jgi:hypothetical protein
MKKQIIDSISKCYSVNAMTIGGRTYLIYAGEGDGSLSLYYGAKYENKIPVWSETEKLGGTMTVCTVDDKEGYFFASTGFFTMIESETSAIYLVRYQNEKFVKTKVCDIPYLHRFDVLTLGKHRYLIACTLHSGKKDKDDWSNPGKVLAAEIPYNLDGDVEVKPFVLQEGLFMNHGFNRVSEQGKQNVLIACKNGVFRVVPPQQDKTEWKIERIFDFPASDVCAYDLDLDGKLEYGIISPFHGNTFSVYKKENGKAIQIYQHPKKLDFYHAIFAGEFGREPSFIIGARKGDMDLYRVFYNDRTKKIETVLIETGAGSSNVRIVHTAGGDLIASANRQKNEAAVYWL